MLASDVIRRSLESIGKTARGEPVNPDLEAEGLLVLNGLLQRLHFPPIVLTDDIPVALENELHFTKGMMKEMADAVRGQITAPQLQESERSLNILLGRYRPMNELEMPAGALRRSVP